MARVACVFGLIVWLAGPARAADLPPGAVARLGDDRFRAGGAVHQLALSPDGKRYATVTAGRTYGAVAITEWDAITGRPIREQEVNAHLFRGIVWNTGGPFAVAINAHTGWGREDAARVFPDDFCAWDFTDAKAVGPPPLPVRPSLHLGDVLLASRPDRSPEYGDFLFSAGGTRVAARWKSADGKRHAVHVFELKPARIAEKLTRAGAIDLGAEGADEVRLSADGRTLVVFRKVYRKDLPAGWTATAWDVATGKPGRPVAVPETDRLILTPDAQSLVLFALGEGEWGFDLFTLATGERKQLARWPYTLRQLDGDEWPSDRGGFAFSPNGREVAVAVGPNTHILDIAKAKELGRFEGHAAAVRAVAWAADGASLATTDDLGLVRLWDANALRPFDEVAGHRAPVAHAELSPDGKRLLTWAWDETARLWDVQTGKELRAFAGAIAPRGADGDRPTFTPGGTAILHNTKRGLVARDLQTGLEVPMPGEMKELGLRFAVFSPDGKAVLTWGTDGRAVDVWDWPGGKKRFTLEDIYNPPADPGFSPGGFAVFRNPRQPGRWDAKTGKELPPAWKENPNDKADSLVSLQPNPRWLLRENPPRVTKAGTDEILPQLRLAHGGDDSQLVGGWGISLSPKGGQFAVALGIEPGDVRLCEAATGLIRRELRGHRGLGRVLGFTPDGTKLLTAGGDHTVLVWDVRLQSVPLPEAVKKETNAAKLWSTLAAGSAKDAYLAMARLARDPDAALKMASAKLRPAAKADPGTDASRIADARAVELLEALDTDEARALLKELAAGHAAAFRTQEAKRALQRAEKRGYNSKDN